MSTVRQLPYAVADGPHNMAADEVLLHSAARGIASLRFYGWSTPTLSLGYFQPERLRRQEERLAALPYVRRPTGGETLVHHHELTYALALPAGSPWQTGEPWPRRMHAIIARVLGIAARLHELGEDEGNAGFLCFRHFTPGDLLIGTAKIAGSAQRRQRKAVLQHGGILLAQSPFTPQLPGVWELTGRALTPEEMSQAILAELTREPGWRPEPADWTPAECRLTEELVTSKYSQDGWNSKR